jgi:shikimate kinase
MVNKTVIFLVGFMGSGKTHHGKQLASSMGVPFADLDALIEAEEGMSVTEIFRLKGESYFRTCESRLLRTIPLFFSTRMINIDHKFSIFGVLSCGGGTPCFNHNMEWMNEHGVTVWIAPDVDILVKRLIGEQETRPLIAGLNETELKNQVEQRLNDRDVYYRQSNLKITNPLISVQELHEQILHTQALF